MSENKYSVELGFILDICLHPDVPRPLPEKIDWNRVRVLLGNHAVKPLFAHNILAGAVVLPDPISDELKTALRESTIQHLYQSAQLMSLYKYMAENGIPAFPTKGPLWSYLFYPVPATRTYSDLDFIIPLNKITDAVASVAANGYEIEPYRNYLIEKGNLLDTLIAEDTQLMFCGRDARRKLPPVEIHWRVIYQRFGDFFLWEELMQNAGTYQINQLQVKAPRPEYQLLLLVIHHGLIEQWSKIKFVVDLVFFLRKEGATLDWDFIRAKASEKAILKIVTDSLELARRFDPSVVPPKALSNPAYSPKRDVLQPEPVWEKGRKEVSTQSLRILLFNIRHRDTFVAKISILARHVRFLSRIKLHLYKLLFSKQNSA
ncbi:nucleotidyltransferase family protein [Ravibacter arvi]|uniref:nucleotidyltransferase family protein n=1 Tax=Ravibacter arvi TaxID=2051041 RepID=UPI0031E99470